MSVAPATRPRRARSRHRLGVENDGHRAVVRQADLHSGAELTPCDPDPLALERSAEPRVERLGDVRVCGARKARPVPLARVGDECELAHDERLASDIADGEIEAPGSVLEDPEVRDLACKPVRLLVGVRRGYSEEDDKTTRARGDGLARHRHRRIADPLHDRTHLVILAAVKCVRESADNP